MSVTCLLFQLTYRTIYLYSQYPLFLVPTLYPLHVPLVFPGGTICSTGLFRSTLPNVDYYWVSSTSFLGRSKDPFLVRSLSRSFLLPGLHPLRSHSTSFSFHRCTGLVSLSPLFPLFSRLQDSGTTTYGLPQSETPNKPNKPNPIRNLILLFDNSPKLISSLCEAVHQVPLGRPIFSLLLVLLWLSF